MLPTNFLKGDTSMVSVVSVFQALAIFAVSIVVLTALHVFTSPRHVAYGVGWLNMQGPVLVYVGLLYVAFGAFLFLYKR
jgi:uncharacterized membrane protein